MRVVMLGDSLTAGSPGVAYLPMLRERIAGDPQLSDCELVNAGVGGDTVAHVVARARRDVAALAPDRVVVFVGVNDALTALLWPRRRSLAAYCARRYWRTQKSLRAPITPERFEDGLRMLVSQLHEYASPALVALCTPAALGEDVTSPEWRLLDHYADSVRRAAADGHCALVDLHAVFAHALHGMRPRRFRPSEMTGQLAGDCDAVACRRGYRLVCDGVHLTSAGASLVARELHGWLREAARG